MSENNEIDQQLKIILSSSWRGVVGMLVCNTNKYCQSATTTTHP